jgi:hypothetical protein
LPSANEIHHRSLRHANAIQTNPFSKVNQVRGGEQAHPKACLLQNRRHHVTHRAFAVRSGDVNHAKGPFRIAKGLAHTSRGTKVCLVGRRALALEHGELGEQRINRAFVGRLIQGRTGW